MYRKLFSFIKVVFFFQRSIKEFLGASVNNLSGAFVLMYEKFGGDCLEQFEAAFLQ